MENREKCPAKILLVSVGGSPAPIAYSIKEHKPAAVIFFVSKNSRKLVSEGIFKFLLDNECSIPDHEFIVTPDEQDVGESVRVLLKQVPKAMLKLGYDTLLWPSIVDYTGGTKTMSAALVWASSKFNTTISYVGTLDESGRNKNGLGVVIDGHEKCFIKENPWNKIAYFEAQEAVILFNRAQYGAASSLINSIIEKVDEDKTLKILKLMRDIFEGYYLWDIFDHRRARDMLVQSYSKIEPFLETEHVFAPYLNSLHSKMKENIDFLNSFSYGKLSWMMIWDLIGNAVRRADIENKYEDATARCYAAIEKIAKYELIKTYGIDTSNANSELIPDTLRNEYIKKFTTLIYTSEEKESCEKIQFGVVAAYKILIALKNKYGIRFEECKNVRDHLIERNKSILGHGIDPIKEKKFTDLLSDALYILDIEIDKLPKFPII